MRHAQVPIDLVADLTSPEDRAKYQEFTLRSFVDDNRKMSWCEIVWVME